MKRDVPMRVAQRAAMRYTLTATGCFESTYADRPNGYPHITWYIGDGRNTTTPCARAAWVFHHDQIPGDLTIDHVCRNTRCVRVDHLRLLSQTENSRRNHGKDFPLGQSCRNGHAASDRYRDAGGRSRCHGCREMDNQRYREQKRKQRQLQKGIR